MQDDQNKPQNTTIPPAAQPPVVSEDPVSQMITPEPQQIAQSLTKEQTSQSSSSAVVQNAQPVPSVESELQEPLPPTIIGSGNKEQEPLPAIGNTEWAKLTEPEMQIPDEVQEIGVTTEPKEIPMLPHHPSAGIQLAKDALAVPMESDIAIRLPMTMVQAQDVIKKDKDVKDSLKWLATLIFREIELARLRKQMSLENK